MYRLILLTFCMFGLPLLANATEGGRDKDSLTVRERLKERGEWLDNKIDKYQHISTDTDYIQRPSTAWTFRMRPNLYGNQMILSPEGNILQRDRYVLQSNGKFTVGLTANYRGLSLTLSLNPRRVFGRSYDQEYGLNYYAGRFGVDIQAGHLTSFTELYKGHRERLQEAELNHLSASAYYVFNHRKFSYSAAINQSRIQKRSAGSVLVGAAGYVSQTNIGDAPFLPLHDERPLSQIKLSFLALGAGYAYNFVSADRHWLVHLSALPHIPILKSTSVSYDDHAVSPSKTSLSLYMVGRVGATYSWKNYFVGLTGIVQLYDAGWVEDIKFNHLCYKGSAYIGLRL